MPSIYHRATGSTLGDFIILAEVELSKDNISVAAVLASAAYEGALKQKATELGIVVEDIDLAKVVEALKSKSFFQGADSKLQTGYVRLRNEAMHADWSKLNSSTVNGLIAYVKNFLHEHFA